MNRKYSFRFDVASKRRRLFAFIMLSYGIARSDLFIGGDRKLRRLVTILA